MENIAEKDLCQNLKELEFINKMLGGHSASIGGIKKLISRSGKKSYHIADIGCGGGDTLRALARWGKKKGYKFQLSGIDLKPECIRYAEEKSVDFANISYYQGDYKELLKQGFAADIYINALFCHHLNEAQIVDLIDWMAEHSTVGFVINDLQRNEIAYWSIKFLSAIFSSSYLLKNDAPLSVLRGFSKKDWKNIIAQCQTTTVKIQAQWAFRWLLCYRK